MKIGELMKMAISMLINLLDLDAWVVNVTMKMSVEGVVNVRMNLEKGLPKPVS